jgi:lipopolysaccharide export system protein LptA
LVLAGVFFLSSLATAAEPEMNHDGSLPVHITSQTLEADDKAGFFVFKGDVQAQQGEVYIYSDMMTVRYSDAENRQIEKVVAEGDVRIVQLNRVATAQHAVFYQQEGRVVLTGDPQVVQGENKVEGERIVVYLNDSRSVVEGGKKSRVKAVFIPGEKVQ